MEWNNHFHQSPERERRAPPSRNVETIRVRSVSDGSQLEARPRAYAWGSDSPGCHAHPAGWACMTVETMENMLTQA